MVKDEDEELSSAIMRAMKNSQSSYKTYEVKFWRTSKKLPTKKIISVSISFQDQYGALKRTWSIPQPLHGQLSQTIDRIQQKSSFNRFYQFLDPETIVQPEQNGQEKPEKLYGGILWDQAYMASPSEVTHFYSHRQQLLDIAQSLSYFTSPNGLSTSED